MRQHLDFIRERLTAAVENLAILEVTESTQAMARELIDDLDQEQRRLSATVIISNRQEHGEGRDGRIWTSPPGGLYLTWLQSGLDAESISRLPMVSAAAAHTAISEIGVGGIRIKWPNDLIVGGRKLAGILIFARHGLPSWVAVGIGVNIASTPTIDNHSTLPATSVAELLGRPDPGDWRDRIAASFVNNLIAALADPQPALAAWRRLLHQQPGDEVHVKLASGEAVAGTLVELLDEGHLRLRTASGDRVISGGDIVES